MRGEDRFEGVLGSGCRNIEPTPSRKAKRRAPGAVVVKLCLVWLTFTLPIAVRAAVELALRMPQSETWVLGDAIPLYWRFSNQSTQALGFMWEGCCRLNGRLDVTTVATSGPLETAPVGQALAHMFAKADRLEPGIAKEYDTKVGDWVSLPGTGRYRLQGTYRGVLPTQFPQVQRGLSLWRDAATSRAVELSVLSVADYLAQREERVGRGRRRVTLTGPNRLSPLEPARFVIRVENLGNVERRLVWPDDAALWVVDAKGRRGAPMAAIGGATTHRVLPPDGVMELAFTIAPDRFESEPLGDYTLFVDLGEGRDGEPRVPSNVLSLAWRLGAAEVEALVREAAKGAGTGGRNAALKTLRVYLGDVGPELATLDRSRLDERARGLAGRLELASRLRPVSPKPGEVGIAVTVGAQGEMGWVEPVFAKILGAIGGGVRSQARELASVRRHLGWELTPVLVPADDTTLAGLLGAGDGLMADASDWTGPPEIRWLVGTNASPARLILRASSGSPNEPKSGPGLRGEDLRNRLRQGPEGKMALPGETRWGEVRRVLEEVLRAGERRNIMVLPPI